MSDSTSIPTPPSLLHHHTFPSPSGTTRAWSSRAHPSSRTPLLATASSDKSVQIWDLRDFKLVSNINGGHKRSVRCVGWKDWGVVKKQDGITTKGDDDEDNTTRPVEKPVTLATGSFDANVGVWIYEPTTSTTSEDKTLLSAVDELDMTNPSDDYRTLDERGENNGAEDEDKEDWHFTTLLTGPDSEIKDLQFSPAHYSANLLATCSRDKSVWIWEEVEDDNEWETIAVLSEHTGDVKCVGWCGGAKVKDPESGEEIVVGSREILATGSYDDTIRLWRDVEEEGDWNCVAVLDGHAGTVWDVCWEGYVNMEVEGLGTGEDVREWEPRILSCSDDTSVRVWKRELGEMEKEKKKARLTQSNGTGKGMGRIDRLPSTIRTNTAMENWRVEAVLPAVHVRSVYAVDWSRKTGLVVSCGGDGTIAVYREVVDEDNAAHEDVEMTDAVATNGATDENKKGTKWVVVALIEAAHDEYEVNHVCWAARRDKDTRWKGEEAIVSTGDDGDVRVWILPDGVIQPS